MELTTLSDAELADQLNAVLAEQERRAALANTATQVEQLTVRYVGIGGDPSALSEAVIRGKDAAAAATVEPPRAEDTTPVAEEPVTEESAE